MFCYQYLTFLHINFRKAKTISMKIFTIGHSTYTIYDFINLLKKNKIKILIDIRTYPGSRYVPWFNKEQLKVFLADNRIEYLHLKILGGRKKSYTQSHFSLVNGWKNKSFLNYASYTLTDEYAKGIDELITKATQKQVAIMCAENLPWRCHRLLISNTLTANNIDVYHILNATTIIKHSLNKYGAYAIVKDKKVLYPLKEF